MNRVTSRLDAEALAAALESFPPHLRDKLKFDLFCGNPVAAGLELDDVVEPYGRSIRDTSHVSYACHTNDARVTVVVASALDPQQFTHELAHVLDDAMGHEVATDPVTRYATTNRGESFAEFVTAALWPGYLPWGNDSVAIQRAPLERLGLTDAHSPTT